MNRRNFIAASGMLAVAAADPDTWLPAVRAADCSVRRLPGLQLYSVRDALRSDLRAALTHLAGIGYRECELFGLGGTGPLFGLPLDELRAALDDAGIAAPLAHLSRDADDVPALAEAARVLGIDTLVMASSPVFSGQRGRVPASDRGQLDRLSEQLDRLGGEFRAHGLRFGYHNHDTEFVPVEGRVAFDYFVERTDPELVKLELDIGWLTVAGSDPIEYLERYRDRVVSMHLKDFAPTTDRDVPLVRQLVPPGAGEVDFAAVLDKMDEIGIHHGYVEVDVSESPMRDMERGLRHLQSLRPC